MAVDTGTSISVTLVVSCWGHLAHLDPPHTASILLSCRCVGRIRRDSLLRVRR